MKDENKEILAFYSLAILVGFTVVMLILIKIGAIL